MRVFGRFKGIFRDVSKGVCYISEGVKGFQEHFMRFQESFKRLQRGSGVFLYGLRRLRGFQGISRSFSGISADLK